MLNQPTGGVLDIGGVSDLGVGCAFHAYLEEGSRLLGHRLFGRQGGQVAMGMHTQGRGRVGYHWGNIEKIVTSDKRRRLGVIMRSVPVFDHFSWCMQCRIREANPLKS